MSEGGAQVLDARTLDRTLRRLALQILEHRPDGAFALVGVRSRGVPLARRLAEILKENEGLHVAVGELDIALYRDDTRATQSGGMQSGGMQSGATQSGTQSGRGLPTVHPTVLPFHVEGAHLVLVDDVLFTGRTVRAALDALVAWGRPQAVRLAVLVDRGHRELPIQADHVGITLETTRAEQVAVRLVEQDGEDGVWLTPRGGT